MTDAEPPRIARSIKLHCQGDWGRANLHRALGWLSFEMVEISGPHTRIAIWNGTGALDNVRAVGRGEVDIAFATPASFVPMAMAGTGPCAGEAFPNLRALGFVPQNDRMIFAIRSSLGIHSFDELRRTKPALRIAAGFDDEINFMGMAAQHLMARSGIPRRELESWGGRYIEHSAPFECVEEVMNGNADAIIQEAVMTEPWQRMANAIDLTFIPFERNVLDALRAEFQWPSAMLPKNYMRGMDRDMEFLDFSHFLLMATTDLPDDVAYALASCLAEKRKNLEAQYRHIPPERSPVSYPIDPKEICRTPIPLHPGAERYFRSAGHL